MVGESKVKSWEEALEWRKKAELEGCKVVFTNGCFDILHLGHVKLLEEAALLGDKLVVAVNSDKSTKVLKGDNRPIRSQEERAEILAGLKSTDVVVVFNEADPLKIILHLKPDVLVKGGDWKVENIIGAKEVKGWGGKVCVIPTLPGRSTTQVLEKTRKTGAKT